MTEYDERTRGEYEENGCEATLTYSFRFLASSDDDYSDYFQSAEDEFNVTVNPKLGLSQPGFELLMADGTEVLSSIPEAVVGKYADLNRQQLLALGWIGEVEYFHEDFIGRIVKLLVQKGDLTISECLTEKEKSDIPRDCIKDTETDDAIRELAKSMSGLILTQDPDGPTIGRQLLPRGLAAYWHMVIGRTDQKEDQLARRVTEFYGLPPVSSYRFIYWKLRAEVGGFPFLTDEFWKHRNGLLQLLNAEPHNLDFISGQSDFTKYRSLKESLSKRGVQLRDWDKIEEAYAAKLDEDFSEKSARISSLPVTILADLLKNDYAHVYGHLESLVKTLLREIDQREPNTLEAEQIGVQIRSLLSSDPLFFIVFFNHVFPAKLERKAGRPVSPRKRGIYEIRRRFVELLAKHSIPYRYDEAARILNALAGEEIYSESPLGASGSVINRSVAGRQGFKSRGGKVLYNELRRL